MKRRRGGTSPEIRIFPNDPDAPIGLVPASPVPPAASDPSYLIEGRRYDPAPYDPGTLPFQYWQGETALRRTIHVWEDLLERDFAEWQSGRPLRVRLRAGRDLNAFYDRESLQFFFDTDPVTGRVVYAAESLDIVAHETGHAVLDIYQPSFWSTPDPETAAFHEAFADCSSLLVTLTDPAVRRCFLSETEAGDGRSNLVSRLAEALGRAVHDIYGPAAISDPTRLRDANNSFQYQSPELLPANGSDEVLSAEPHSFSRVFTGAFYDLLIWLIARALREDPSDPEAAVERARRLCGRILARAVETSAPGTGAFRAVALRMREVDQKEEGGVATIGIETAFLGHGVRLPDLAARRRKQSGAPKPHAHAHALDPDRPGGQAAIREALKLPAGAPLERATVSGRFGASREQLVHRESVVVRHASLGAWSGIVVPVVCGCTLTRDAAGRVDAASLRPHPHPEGEEIARWLLPWIARGAIGRDGRDGAATSVEHFRARQPFRVTASGLLERVFLD